MDKRDFCKAQSDTFYIGYFLSWEKTNIHMGFVKTEIHACETAVTAGNFIN